MILDKKRVARAVLVGPGELSEERLRERARDRWIAIDGGLDRCRELGRLPQLAIGDWDSLRSPQALEGVAHVTLARDKDRSDFFHGLLVAASMGLRDVEGWGLTGGRPDHHQAVLADAGQAVASGRIRRVHLIGPEAEYVVFARGVQELRLSRGAVVSVFALGGPATGVTLQGLKYPLSQARLEPSSRGLSNTALRSRVTVRCASGVLLVIAPAPKPASRSRAPKRRR